MPVDLTTFWEFATPIAGALGAYFLNRAANVAEAKLGVQQGSQQQTDLSSLLWHGEVLAQDWWHSLEAHNKTANIPSGTLSNIVNTAIELAPGVAAADGITPETIGTMIQARLNTWLHTSGKIAAVPPARIGISNPSSPAADSNFAAPPAAV